MHVPARHAARSRSIRAGASLAILALVATACGGAASTSPTTLAGSPGASGAACAAAPAPPPNQEGWSTAEGDPTVYPVIVNSTGSLTCGENRLVFTFLDAENRPVAVPDRTASVAIYNRGRDGASPTETAEADFLWGIEGERGFYVAYVTFDEAGEWGAEFTTTAAGGSPETVRMIFQVATSSTAVRVGDRAPAADTPTAASVDGDLARISTDDDPEPAFYETSVSDALDAGEPFVLVFATPKFCVSAQCGPTLETIKPLVAKHPDVAFIHVEPYEMTFKDGSLQPALDAGGALVPTQLVFEWGLLSEPWIFVVDREGIVRGSYEGVVGADELEAAIEAVEG